MTVPSQMSLRRIPDALHLQVRVGYAASWEAIIDTHTRQALQFVTEFAPRISVLEGLDLYFRVTAVPESMHEVVRSRTLTALDLKTIPPPMELPALTGWGRLRLDLVLEHRRYRRRYNERTLELDPASTRANSYRKRLDAPQHAVARVGGEFYVLGSH